MNYVTKFSVRIIYPGIRNLKFLHNRKLWSSTKISGAKNLQDVKYLLDIYCRYGYLHAANDPLDNSRLYIGFKNTINSPHHLNKFAILRPNKHPSKIAPTFNIENFCKETGKCNDVSSVIPQLNRPCSLSEVVQFLKDTYCGHLSAEFMHLEVPVSSNCIVHLSTNFFLPSVLKNKLGSKSECLN